MLQWTSESCTEKNLTESGVNLVSCNSILMFFSYICIIKFYRSRSLEWSHCYWVSNRYTVFWRIYIRLVVSGLNACEPLESLWYTLQFNHSSLFNQLRQNWADPTCALRSLWWDLKHCKPLFQKHATAQKMWGMVKSSVSVTAAWQRSACAMLPENIEALSVSLCGCTGTKVLTSPVLTPTGPTESTPSEVMVGTFGSPA